MLKKFNFSQNSIIKKINEIIPTFSESYSLGWCHGLVMTKFVIDDFRETIIALYQYTENKKTGVPTGLSAEEEKRLLENVEILANTILAFQTPFLIISNQSQFNLQQNIKLISSKTVLYTFHFKRSYLVNYTELAKNLTSVLPNLTKEQILQVYVPAKNSYHSISIRNANGVFYYYDPNVPDGEIVCPTIASIIEKLYSLSSGKDISTEFKNGQEFISYIPQVISKAPITNQNLLKIQDEPPISPKSFLRRGVKEETLLHDLVFTDLNYDSWVELLKTPEALNLIDIKDKHGNTPLHYACMFNNMPAIIALIRTGAKLNIVNNSSQTVLDCAAEGCNAGAVLELKDLIPKIGTVIHSLQLLQKGIGIPEEVNFDWPSVQLALNTKMENGNTPVLLAAKYGKLEEIRSLLKAGSGLNEQNNDGDTALMFAAAHGRLEVVKLLIEEGSDLTIKNHNGITALMWAATNDHLEVVKFLIEKGSDLEVKNGNGETVLMFAAARGCLEIIQFLVVLIGKSTKFEEKNNDGYTILMLAATNGHSETVKFLLEKGAKLDEKNNNDHTALMLATANGHLETVKYLENYSAKLRQIAPIINNVTTFQEGTAYQKTETILISTNPCSPLGAPTKIY